MQHRQTPQNHKAYITIIVHIYVTAIKGNHKNSTVIFILTQSALLDEMMVIKY